MLTRRVLLGCLGTALPLAACGGSSVLPVNGGRPAPSSGGSDPADERTGGGHSGQTGTVPTRPLGKTGALVSMLGLGGHHLGQAGSEEEAARLVHHALDHGLTFMDNCWDYHGGRSEEWLGKALAGGWRQKAFVMTKTDGHTREACGLQLEQSLNRLRTDVIDLVQFHEVIRKDDPDEIFAPGGAIEALLAARKAGKVRFIGFTGHKDPAFHLAMLARSDAYGFAFDTVQMPLNVLDAHYKSFEQRVLPELTRRNIGVLGMKSIAAGYALQAGVTAEECLRYALSLPTSVVITGCESIERVEQALRVARTFRPLAPSEREALLARTKPHASDGQLERFKTSNEFDGTMKNPQWLTTADARGKT